MQKTLHSEQQGVLLAMLRQERERAGLTQAELAARIGSTQSDVSKCEIGVRRLDVLELRTWLTAIGIRMPVFAQALEERLDGMSATATGARRAQRRPSKPAD